MKYSIAIVTFDMRLNKYLKPLVNFIKKERPDIELLLQINGNYKEIFPEQYRKDILNLSLLNQILLLRCILSLPLLQSYGIDQFSSPLTILF